VHFNLSIDEQAVARVTEIILKKAEEDSSFASTLSPLFSSYSEVNKVLIDLFDADFDLLKRAYFAVAETARHSDYDAVTFTRILDHDPDFIEEYIDRMYAKAGRLPQYDDTRDYSILWKRDDYEQLMTRVVERVYEHEQDWGLDGEYLGVFFGLEGNRQPDPQVQKTQNGFLRGLIGSRHEAPGLMQFVFSVIAEFPPERRRPFVALFITHNRSFELFQKLPLEPSSFGWSGSAVPMLQGRMEYLESLLPLLNTVDLLRHKQYAERRIQEIRTWIEQEKKRDFMED
jgi:hypothetical protein